MGSQTCEPVPANEIGMGDCYSQLAISGFYSFCMHLDITNYHQKMERMGEENHSSDRPLDQEVQAKCVCVCACACIYVCMYVRMSVCVDTYTERERERQRCTHMLCMCF